MDDIYKNTEKYNPNNNRKLLIAFHEMIADRLSNKKLNPIITEIFIRGGKLNTSLVFSTQSYFTIPENIRLNSTQYFVTEIQNKRQLQKIAFNHSLDSDIQDFLHYHQNYHRVKLINMNFLQVKKHYHLIKVE